MENTKNRSLTCSEALKLYTGKNIAETLVKVTIMAACLLGVFTMLVWGIGIFAKDMDAAMIKEMCERSFSIGLGLSIYCAIGSFMMYARTFERGLPGGKFFRTVKGGFDTYKKVRFAQHFAAMYAVVIYYVMLVILMKAGLISVRFGLNACISAALFTILSMCVVNFLTVVQEPLRRGYLMTIPLMAFPAAGILLLELTDGRLGVLHIVVAVLDVAGSIISQKVMLSFFKKHRWDN